MNGCGRCNGSRKNDRGEEERETGEEIRQLGG
jgi:hypothetical protein